MSRWIKRLLVVPIFLGLALAFYLNLIVETPKTLLIPKGSSTLALKSLQSNHVDINKLDIYLMHAFGWYLQSGWIDMGAQKMSKYELLHRLAHAKATQKQITLIPGETTYYALKNLATTLHLSFEKLQRLYKQKSPFGEGVLFPDTYNVAKSINEEALIEHLLQCSMQKHKLLAHKYLHDFNQTQWFKEVITKASIIQKESKLKEMPLVSAVIHNRLKKGMRLQMDGTLNYGKYSHTKITAKRIKEDTSPFNTYKIKGLPPTPICLVQYEAIDAVFNYPKDSNYLYFFKTSEDSHTFSATYQAHQKLIQKSN